ncbi:putative wd domain-containing protein [Eutypa lata UCREL1]|uniref:Putative wd domain-containing protein n=1 Tax=Eutypa lata (strain UCR-EL1) TaxID=1287681 RepID=M7SQB5_EUTLA|nr:putative wd domain-containing protein [Eutypa lata UCREL1]
MLLSIRVLDAPGLRDDFYCSIMAYDVNCNTLAVGLGNLLYGWSESTGVNILNAGLSDGSWLTSVAFSSEQGEKSILAFGDQEAPPTSKSLPAGSERYRWQHGAAVKAIAFCPWRKGLIATGGGSNDKCIHFFHTSSGAALASISVAAQVTSLIWSTTRREIVATFGYAQPDHPYRIAVFSWPECPEGCIVVASSDESVKFHEVWTAGRKATTGLDSGVLAGSDILEMNEGIDKEGDVIR